MEALRESNHDAGRIDIAAFETAACHESGTKFVEISISDEGPGFSPEVSQFLFEPFFSTKAEGMGMGLVLSKTIVEAHQGRMWVDSEAKAGATFRFTLPVAGTEGAEAGI